MAKYNHEVRNYLLDHIDIIQVISGVVSLKRAGRNHKGLCPFHGEKTPSFSVSADRQFYHCFGCGAAGNAIDFVMQTENLDFLDALESLAERYSVDISQFLEQSNQRNYDDKKVMYAIMKEAARLFFKQLAKHDEARGYLINRGLSEKIMRKFGIGFAPDSWDFLLGALKSAGYSEAQLLQCGLIVKNERGRYYDRFRNRIIFPIFDRRGRVVAFGGRVMDDSVPKYLNSPETPIFFKSNVLYGLNFAQKSAKRSRRVYLVEGYMDVIALQQHGYDHAVASLGTALTEHHIKQLDRLYDEVVFAYDMDNAGQKAIAGSLETFKKTGLKVFIIDMGDAKDPDELLRSKGRDALQKYVDDAMNIVEFSIKRLATGYNLKDEDDKMRYLQSVYASLEQSASAVQQDLYIGRLAKELQLNKQAIVNDYHLWQQTHHTEAPKSIDRHTEPIPDSVQDITDYSEIAKNDLPKETNLYRIEKALLKMMLVDTASVDKIVTQCEKFYYEVLETLKNGILAYYKHTPKFEFERAIDHFDIEQLKLLQAIDAVQLDGHNAHATDKTLMTHQKYLLEMTIKDIDSQLQRLSLSSDPADELKLRTALTERSQLAKQLTHIAARMRSL